MGGYYSHMSFRSKQAIDAITLRNQQESPFFRLPPEVRNECYAHTLGFHRICVYSQIGIEGINDRVCEPAPIGDLLSITMTCRQILAESALMFFRINEFGAHGNAPAAWNYQHFLNNLTAQQRESIAHWWTDTCCMQHVTEIRVPLDRLPGVRSLKIEQCEVEVMPRAANEARIKKMVRDKAGRDGVIIFDYTTQVDAGPEDIEYRGGVEDGDGDGDDADSSDSS